MNIHPKGYMYIALGIIAVVAAVIAFSLPKLPEGGPGVPPPPEGPITIRGQVLCLPHKGNSEVQTLECAFGLKDHDGLYYGLSDTDPEYSNVGTAPMNTEVEVTGTFTKREDTTYPTVGTITVTKIIQIEPEDLGSNAPVVPVQVTVEGVVKCLPHKGDGPHTLECRYGLSTAGGVNYALDMQKLPNESIEADQKLTVSGMMTPVEMLSADFWQTYDVKGVITVSTVSRA